MNPKTVKEYQEQNKKVQKEMEKKAKTCNHDWNVVYKGDYPTGQRCSKCLKQEWF